MSALLAAGIITAAVVVPVPVAKPCAPRADMVEKLATKWSERRIDGKMQADGTVLELFASDAGSYTFIISSPDGHSCVSTIGEGWLLRQEVPL